MDIPVLPIIVHDVQKRVKYLPFLLGIIFLWEIIVHSHSMLESVSVIVAVMVNIYLLSMSLFHTFRVE